MRFNILVAASFLFTLAAGLAIPVNTLSSRDHEEDTADLFAREPVRLGGVLGKPAIALKKKSIHHVLPAHGKPAHLHRVLGKPASAFKPKARHPVPPGHGNHAQPGHHAVPGELASSSGQTNHVAAGDGDHAQPGKDAVSGEPANTPGQTYYHVAAGNGKPAQTYTQADVDKAVKKAQAEHIKIGKEPADAAKVKEWNTAKKKSLLRSFDNRDHITPQVSGPIKPLPSMNGPGMEYPLPDKTGKRIGPARIILQETDGKLEFKGVVAHDQGRANLNKETGEGFDKSTGLNDHFEVQPSKVQPSND